MQLIEFVNNTKTGIGKWLLISDGVDISAKVALVEHLETLHFTENILPQYLAAGVPSEAVLVYNPNNKELPKTPPLPRLFTVEADAIGAGIDAVALESLLTDFEGKTAAEKLQAANRVGYVVMTDKPIAVKGKKAKTK